MLLGLDRILTTWRTSDKQWKGFAPFTFKAIDGALLSVGVHPDLVGYVKATGASPAMDDWFVLLLKEYKPSPRGAPVDYYDMYVVSLRKSHVSRLSMHTPPPHYRAQSFSFSFAEESCG